MPGQGSWRTRSPLASSGSFGRRELLSAPRGVTVQVMTTVSPQTGSAWSFGQLSWDPVVQTVCTGHILLRATGSSGSGDPSSHPCVSSPFPLEPCTRKGAKGCTIIAPGGKLLCRWLRNPDFLFFNQHFPPEQKAPLFPLSLKEFHVVLEEQVTHGDSENKPPPCHLRLILSVQRAIP